MTPAERHQKLIDILRRATDRDVQAARLHNARLATRIKCIEAIGGK